jgi:hypothetical protein
MILSRPAILNEMRQSLHHILQHFVACLPRYVTWKPFWEFMIFSWIYIRPLTSQYNSIMLFQKCQPTHNRKAMAQTKKRKNPNPGIDKCPTGITGFDEVTDGGLSTESMG